MSESHYQSLRWMLLSVDKSVKEGDRALDECTRRLYPTLLLVRREYEPLLGVEGGGGGDGGGTSHETDVGGSFAVVTLSERGPSPPTTIRVTGG
ncbi:MAG: hypothetical protein GY820_35615, partial [Gammaproteobacteria bacterium]|nr:hypothetical protein [Gammaproteobacteria bacterium]